MNGNLGCLHKADMFALGATLLELATRAELPSGGQQYQDLRAGRLPMLPTCTQRFANMIRWVGSKGVGWGGAGRGEEVRVPTGAVVVWLPACLAGCFISHSLTLCCIAYVYVLHRALMAPNPEDRPSAEKVLQSQLLARKPASPQPLRAKQVHQHQEQQQQQQQQPAQHQSSTCSTQSAATVDTSSGAAAAAGSKVFGGLVLQRSKAK
jgi:hypothetical protein